MSRSRLKVIIAEMLVLLLVLFTSCNNRQNEHKISRSTTNNIVNFSPSDPLKEGYVPDEKTAIKIAEAVWMPIYGEEILKYRPYKAKLKDGNVWIVRGEVHSHKGGSPFALIQKSDGKILDVFHEK